MKEQTTNEAQAIAALAVASAEVKFVAGNPFAVVPEGYSAQNLEGYLLSPNRKRGTFVINDAASFVAFVKKHATDSTTVYRSVNPPKFEAVFNDHGEKNAAAGWGDFLAQYACPLSVEWQTWTAADKKQMSQEGFAQFIEDNLPDIVDPTAAHMLEISRTLQAKKKVNFASGIRLSNGENQLTYEEKVEGSAGAKGQLKVPEIFTIGIAVFEGGPKYAVKARLRYRIADGGQLTMWFDLERPHKIIEDAVGELTKDIEAKTGLPTVNGRRERPGRPSPF